jgi:hypothetical protein
MLTLYVGIREALEQRQRTLDDLQFKVLDCKAHVWRFEEIYPDALSIGLKIED